MLAVNSAAALRLSLQYISFPPIHSFIYCNVLTIFVYLLILTIFIVTSALCFGSLFTKLPILWQIIHIKLNKFDWHMEQQTRITRIYGPISMNRKELWNQSIWFEFLKKKSEVRFSQIYIKWLGIIWTVSSTLWNIFEDYSRFQQCLFLVQVSNS